MLDIDIDMPTDSHEYHILKNATIAIKNVKGMTCELGVRRGGGTKTIIDALIDNDDLYRHHICVDPYGNIEYNDGNAVTRYDYTNDMKNDCLLQLYNYCHSKPINLHFFVLEDTEFFKRYSDGIPVYNVHKYLLDKYALVHFDGPHDSLSINKEVFFFKDKCNIGSIFVFDDLDNYKHDLTVEPNILKSGFEIFEKGNNKASYIKVKL